MFQAITTKFTGFVATKIDQAAHRDGQRMVQLAQQLAPVDTGRLRSEIHYTWDAAAKRLELIAPTPWAMYQEFGTYRMPPHPFLRPAVEAVGPSFFSPYNFGMTVGTTMSPFAVPRQIQPHIRPHIAAANARFNRGRVGKTRLTAIHHGAKNWRGQAVRTDRTRIHKHKKAWN